MSPPSPHGSRSSSSSSSMSSLPKAYAAYDDPAAAAAPRLAHRAPYPMAPAFPPPPPRSPPPSYPPPHAAAGAGAPQHRKKYQCTTCGRGFTTGGHLARHRRIHTGERNHVCPFPGCETRCSRQDNLQQHYRIHLSPGSRRTTGQATRAAMHRAMSQSRRPPPASAAAAQTTPPAQYTHARLPPMHTDPDTHAKEEREYAPSPLPARAPPPDQPPPLECAYRGGAGSVSGASSARASPELPPYPLARAAAAFPAAGYPPPAPAHAHAHAAPRGAQWELGSRSGPNSPDYEDEPSPDDTAPPYTDTDGASSSGSSAGSPQALSPQGTPRSYGYPHAHAHSLSLPPADPEPAARPAQAAPHLYYAYPASPVSPAPSQPPSPTYAPAPFAPAHAQSFAGGLQQGYAAQPVSPAHRYAHYEHPAAHAHPKFPSGTTLAPLNVHVAGGRDDPRAADRRRAPTPAAQLHPHSHSHSHSPQPAHAHTQAGLYGYSPYSPLSPEQQSWGADALRARTTLAVH